MKKIIALSTIIAPLMLGSTAAMAGTPTTTEGCLKMLDTLASSAGAKKISEDMEKKLEPLAETLTQKCEAKKFADAEKLYQQIDKTIQGK